MAESFWPLLKQRLLFLGLRILPIQTPLIIKIVEFVAFPCAVTSILVENDFM